MTHEPVHEDRDAAATEPRTAEESPRNGVPPGDTPQPPLGHSGVEAAGTEASSPGAAPDTDAFLRGEALAERLETLLQQGPHCVEMITRTLDGMDAFAAGWAEAADGSLGRIETACEQAEALEDRLAVTAERLTDLGESVQRRIELLLKGLEAGDTLQNRLQECSEQLELLVGGSQRASAQQGEKLQQLVATCDERRTALERDARRIGAEVIEAISRRAEAVVAQSEKQLNEHTARTTAVSDELRGAQQAVERRLDALETSLLEKVDKSIAARVAEFDQGIRDAADAHLGRVTGVLDECAARSQALQHDAAEAEHRGKQLERMLDELATSTTKAEMLAAELENRRAQATEAAEAVEAASRKSHEGADALLKFGEAAVSRHRRILAGAIDDAKRVTEDLQTGADEAGRRVEQLAAVEEKCTRTKEDLSALTSDAENLVSRQTRALTKVVGGADMSSQSAANVIDSVRRTAAELSTDVRAGADLHEKLTRTVESVTELLESARTRSDTLTALTVRGEKAAETAGAEIKKLNQETGAIIKIAEEAAAEQRAELEAVAAKARVQGDLLKNHIEAAEQNCAQLASRTHSAVEAESALCGITSAAHDIRDRVERTTAPLKERIARAEGLADTLQEACSHADGTQQKVRELDRNVATLIASGEAALAQRHDVLLAAVAQAGERMDDLRAAMAGATQQREEIAAQFDHAVASAAGAGDRVEGLISELSSLATKTEQRARELDGEVRGAGQLLQDLSLARAGLEASQRDIARQGETARSLIEQLETQIGGGNEMSDHLSTIQAEGSRIMDVLASQCDTARGIVDRISCVAANLEADHDSIAANREALEALSQQSRSLRDMVHQAELKTDSLRVQINGLLTEPQTVVCDAKQQAFQLTKVCHAVKKVFGGLSRSSLLATEKIDQLAMLRAEVIQATNTLQQWVNEAAHVQQRLESAVQSAPGIAKTHPPDRLYTLAGRSALGDRAVSGRPRTTPAEREHLRPVDAAMRAPRGDSGPRIGADEVAELIADAKRYHEREKHVVPSP